MFGFGLVTDLKIGAAIVGALALGALWLDWEHKSAEAAKVPQLEQTIAADDKKANDLSNRLASIDAAKAQEEEDYARWAAAKAPALTNLQKEGAHASAATNSVCAPSDADRSVRNDFLDHFAGAGQAAGAAVVPAGGQAPH